MSSISLFGLIDISLRNIFIVVVLVATIIFYNYKRWKLYTLASKLEGPVNYPIIGGAHHFLGLDTTAITATVLNYVKIYKSPLKFWLGPRLIIVVNKPEDLHDVLTSQNCLDKDEFYRILNDIAKTTDTEMTSLIISPASVWKPNRKMLNPCFSASIMNSFLPIFNEESNRMVGVLERNLNKGSFDMFKFGAACSLDMICRSAMGVDMNIQKDQNYDFIDAFEDVFEVMFERIYKLWLRPNFLFKRTSYYKNWEKNTKVLHDFETEILNKKTEQFKNGTSKIDPEKCDIFLHQLIKSHGQGKLSDNDVMGEVATLLLAGNDTTATSLSFTLLSVAMHPEIQERLYTEIIEAFPDKEFEVTLEDITRLTYLDMVFKESLRIFPVVPFIARHVTSDMKMGDKIVPAGVSILIPIYALHHDQTVWGPNAEKFDPDNFLPENVAQRHPCSFIPFSTGPRNCIGMKQGVFAVKTMMVHLLKAYKFSTHLKLEELRLKTNITMKVLDKHMVTIERRI